MPELHKNQIQWQAPEPQKVSFDKPDLTPLANALGNLANTADAVSKTSAAYNDNQLAKNLEAANARAIKAFEEQDSLDANYDEIANNAIKDWRNQFESMDDATKTRFLRRNPNAAENFEILVQSKAFEKRNEQIYNRSKLDIAQWSSEVVNAGIGIKDPKKRAELQNQIKRDKVIAIQNLGLPIKMTDELLFKFQSELDDYSIAYAIANRHFGEARRLLKEDLPTKGASARAMYWQQLQGAIQADAREKAMEAAALAEAKANGTDTDSKLILELHQSLLAQGAYDAANELRNNYYSGKDIGIPDEKGIIRKVIHSSDVSPVGRDKLYASMLTASNRAPQLEEYRAQYQADFNRLASGLRQSDGSLDLEEGEYVTPGQYALALQLRKKDVGWKMLDKADQTFVDNVLRSFGTEEGLHMIDLNPNTKVRATSILTRMNYQKANPVVDYQGLLNFYNNPANVISAALNGDTTLTGREADVISHYADPYKKEKYKGEYEIERGTRPDALISMFVSVATENNPYGMKDVGLEQVPRKWLESNVTQYVEQIKQDGRYKEPATYDNLMQDFKNVYLMTTGHQYVAPKDTIDPLQKYATLAYYGSVGTTSNDGSSLKYADQLPRSDAWVAANTYTNLGFSEKEFEEKLYKTDKKHVIELDKQRAKSLEKDQVTTYEPGELPKRYEYHKEEDKVDEKNKKKRDSSVTFRSALLGVPVTVKKGDNNE